MKILLALGLPLALAGCAHSSCDPAEPGSDCRRQWLLQQNDLLQAKILTTAGDPEGFELAHALLDRAGERDTRGEVELYRALLLMQEHAGAEPVLQALQAAADKRHPHAIALLYRIYSTPLLVEQPDPEAADRYRQAYAELDVARSGYPSFEHALALADRLVAPHDAGRR